MPYGLNRAEVIGRLGADAEIRHTQNGSTMATFSVATDEGWIDKTTGSQRDKTEWHRVVTFQDGLVKTIEQHAHKGRLVYVSGKLQTRSWEDQHGAKRYSTEIVLAGYGSVLQFLDKPKRNGGDDLHLNAPEATDTASPEAFAAAAQISPNGNGSAAEFDPDIPF